MITIKKIRRKCSVCGVCRAGWLMKEERLERLAPVFLCENCTQELRIRTCAVHTPEEKPAVLENGIAKEAPTRRERGVRKA